jgi:undecaprenyl-diphosphatase
MSRRFLLILLLWLAAFGVALSLDQPVATYAREHGWDNKNAWTKDTRRLAEAFKIPGEYWFAAAVAALAVLGRSSRERAIRAALLVAVAGALSGANGLLKWIVGRRRPVVGESPFTLHPFVGGLPGLFGAEKNLSFPSGHACLAFAVAAAMAILLPRWRWLFYAVAAATAVERIVENAHWVSDTVAAAAVGVLAAKIAQQILDRMAPRQRPPPIAFPATRH